MFSVEQREYARWLVLSDQERLRMGLVRTKQSVASRLGVSPGLLRQWEKSIEFQNLVVAQAQQTTITDMITVLAAIREYAKSPLGSKDRQLLVEKIYPAIRAAEKEGQLAILREEQSFDTEAALALLDTLPIEYQSTVLDILRALKVLPGANQSESDTTGEVSGPDLLADGEGLDEPMVSAPLSFDNSARAKRQHGPKLLPRAKD